LVKCKSFVIFLQIYTYRQLKPYNLGYIKQIKKGYYLLHTVNLRYKALSHISKSKIYRQLSQGCQTGRTD